MRYWGRFLIQSVGVVVLLGSVPNAVFGASELTIPDMNVLGEDLSLYGLGSITAADMPAYDKESFISERFFKSGFSRARGEGQSLIAMLNAGSSSSAGARAAYLSRRKADELGFIAGADTKHSGSPGRRRFLYGADLFYKRTGIWSFHTLPYLHGRNYELPASLSEDISEILTALPVALYSQSENYFVSFSAEQVLMSGSYPAAFYVSGRSAEFSSTRLGVSADKYLGSSSFSLRAGLSRDDWDWVDGEKTFSSFSSDFSVRHKFDGFDIDAGLDFLKRADSDRTGGKLLVSFPALGGSVTAGLDPDNSAPQVEDIFARRGSLLRSFPAATRESWKNVRAEYLLSLYPAGLKLTARRGDTRGFFYSDQSSPSPGTLDSFRYRRNELGAEFSLLLGHFSSGLRFRYTASPNFLPEPRSSAAVFTEYKQGRIGINSLVSRVSKGPWTESFVNGLLKIYYTIPSGTSLFLAADNIFGNKVFLAPFNSPVSPYEWRSSAFFSAGLEIRWGE